MDVPVLVPQLGNEITEAEVTEWIRQEGDEVKAGEQIVVITTTKLSMEIDAPVSGRLSRIVAPEGDLVEVGATLAIISA